MVLENKMRWGKKLFQCCCILSQSLCIPPRDFVSASKTLVMEMLWGKNMSVLLWENNTVFSVLRKCKRECKCNVALLRTNAKILSTNPEFHWGIQYFWKRTQNLSENDCIPHKTLRLLTKHLRSLAKLLLSSPQNVLFSRKTLAFSCKCIAFPQETLHFPLISYIVFITMPC